jgi:hypothetical protein
MEKHLKHYLLFVLIFTTLIFAVSCKKDEVNKPPAVPTIPVPADNEDSVIVVPTIGWLACTDPENDSVKYDVYLGKTDPPALAKSNISGNSYKPDTLKALTKYYWMVVAKDINNNTASSSVWNFTTGAEPGDLEVFVTDTLEETFYGGAEVFFYKSEADRTNDPQRTSFYKKAITDNTDPINIGAIFYRLINQKYYVFCRWDQGMGDIFTGVGESFVPAGKKTKLTVKVQ